MGRSDARRLDLPANERVPKPAPEEPVEMHEPVKAAEEPTAVEKPKLEACPHCGARLSPLDLKMNKCFRCWALLDADGPTNPPYGRANFEVHI